MFIKNLFYIIPLVLLNGAYAGIDQFINQQKYYKIISKIPGKEIYQISSQTALHNNWTCGYFALKNAFYLEENLGIGHKCDFDTECVKYYSKIGASPTKGTTNMDLINLADQYLGLKNLYPVCEKNGYINPLIPQETISFECGAKHKSIYSSVNISKYKVDTKVYAPFGTSKHLLTQEAQFGKLKKINELVKGFKNSLNSMYQQTNQVFHFVCNLNGKNHWILVSVVKIPFEKPALLIFDNLNSDFTKDKETMNYINSLSNLFLS